MTPNAFARQCQTLIDAQALKGNVVVNITTSPDLKGMFSLNFQYLDGEQLLYWNCKWDYPSGYFHNRPAEELLTMAETLVSTGLSLLREKHDVDQ